MPLVYQTFYQKHYKAECCSCVAIITLTIYLLTLFLTFFFVYTTNGLWKQIATSHEQPTVNFKNEFYLEILDSSGTSQHYSTVKSLQEKVMNPLSPPLVKVSRVDDNGDEVPDKFMVKINFKNDPQQLRKVRLLCVVDYALKSTLKIQMQSLLELNVDTPSGASSILSDGYITLKQRKSPLIDSIKRTLYN